MEPKQRLLGQFRTAINRVQLAYASIVLWSYPDTPRYFKTIHSAIGPELRPLPDVERMVNTDAELKIACEELYNSAFRAALIDLLPLLKTYCHDTGQTAKLKEQQWFQFWRILRNCFAHDMVFNFNPAERAVLPVSWSGVTIDISMNHAPLLLRTCPREKMLELVREASTFIDRDLA